MAFSSNAIIRSAFSGITISPARRKRLSLYSIPSGTSKTSPPYAHTELPVTYSITSYLSIPSYITIHPIYPFYLDINHMSDKRNFFVDYSSSDEEPAQEAERKAAELRDPNDELFEENFQKYIHYLKEFGSKTEEIEERVFGDGIWYVNHPLIEVSQINYEKNVGIFDMIRMEGEKSTQTQWVKKVLVSFTFVDNQLQKVIEILEHDLYDSMVMYGEEASGKVQGEPPEIMTARVMSIYKKVYELVKKIMAYIQNLILQLHSMINKKSGYYKQLFKGLDYSAVFDLIGKALAAVYIIDSIVQNNGNILTHWEAYKKLIKLAKNEPEKFGTKPNILKKLEKTMNKYENTILSKSCMAIITEINYDETLEKSNSPLGRIEKNKQLKEAFEVYFNNKLKSINQHLGTKIDMDEEKKLLELMCTYTIYKKLFSFDQLKDFWKQLWMMQKKIPIIQAHSFVFVYVCVFMNEVCPLEKRPSSLDPKDERSFISQYMGALEENISIEIVSHYTKFCVWLSRMESVATSNSALNNVDRKQEGKAAVQQRISNRIYMLCEGFNTILRLYKLIYLCFMLHINEEKAISKNLLGKLILGIQTVKATAYILKKRAQAFDTMVLSKTLAKDILIIFNTSLEKVKNERAKRENIQKVNVYFQIVQLLDTPLSQLKITWIKQGLGFISDWVVADGEIKSIRNLIKKLEIVSYNRVLTQRYQNFSFLYQAKDVLPQIFDYKRQNPQTCKRLQFLFEGFEDASHLLQKCPHLENQQELFEEFKKLLISSFENNYMIPLKRNLEDFLRVSTSSMLIEKLEGVRPWVGELQDLMRMVQFEKVRIFDAVVDLKFEISQSFNSSFYNLNILNMHDMETYEMMRTMGNHLFDLKLHDVFLPNHTIERDKFDILAVVRNIPAFVNTYKYNILNQKFLEITGDNKIISCVSIQQLSDSIKTHGLGILSTTVNAFYKFLITKVTAFSKFLFMQDIQNILSRDRKWFKEYNGKEDYPGFYPYQRAVHIYNQIKKLAKFQEDTNYLDKFRDIITSVGNSLGFIRLIRSASLHTESRNIEYLPNRADIGETFEQIANKSTLGDVSKSACRELDEMLKSLEDRFSDRIDYLNLMVKAFSKLVTKENKHLKLFYEIIPALSINCVEHITRGKEQSNKKITSRAFIYDDGFVLGLAYFLTLLGQHDHYKTLHWEEAAKTYFAQTKKESKAATVDTANHSAKFIEDLNMQKQLLVRKLQFMEEEFTFFEYNMNSAKVLFKSNKGQPQPAKEAPPPPASA